MASTSHDLDTKRARELREQLVEQMIEARALHSSEWIEAFRDVPRHTFVLTFALRDHDGLHQFAAGGDFDAWLEAAYRDTSLLTQFAEGHRNATSSSSQPTVMALMLEALDGLAGQRMLEIGTGTGYNAALLCHRFGDSHVTSMDIDPELVNQAREHLARLGMRPTLGVGDGAKGWPAGAPYDRILATCGIPRIPQVWLEQAAPGAVIVANLGTSLVRCEVNDGGGARGNFLPQPAVFMMLRHQTDCSQQWTPQVVESQSTVGWQDVDIPDDLDHPDAEAYRQLAIPGLIHYPGAVYTYGDLQSGSQVSIDAPNSRIREVGERPLWQEIQGSYRQWVGLGRPAMKDLTVHVDPNGTHRLAGEAGEWVTLPSIVP